MAQVKREQPNYLLIGAFMFLGILSILIGVVVSDKLIYKLKGGYPLHLSFNFIDGLSVGSKVNIGSGKDIGNVSSIKVEGAKLLVTVIIDKKYKINNTAVFQIFSTSLVGGKYLAVEGYTGKAPYFDPNQRIIGVDPFSFNNILSMAGSLFSSGESTDLSDGLGGIFKSLNKVSAQVDQLLQDNNSNINLVITNITEASTSLNKISANLERKLGKISDAEFVRLVDDLKHSMSNLNILLEDINSPNAPLSILKDPQINNSIRTIVTNLEETTKRVKAKPSLLLKN
ncbi:MAG: MlaD family protein [Brevinema sp.]